MASIPHNESAVGGTDGIPNVTKILDGISLNSTPAAPLGGLSTATVEEPSALSLVDTSDAVGEMVNSLEDLPTTPPSLYCDLEGVYLSRHGSVSIMQIYVLPTKKTYLLDVHTLGKECFSTNGKSGRTLKDILESNTIPKVFFDVRNDSDALYSHFDIKLAGIQDLQLMELATRNPPKRYVAGLSRCIDRDASLSPREQRVCSQVKEKGLRLFAPEKGGKYEVFNERPLSNDLMNYCAQDVQVLPALWKQYDRKLGTNWRSKVHLESESRVKMSQTATYNGKGRHMALAPTAWT